MSLAVRLRFFGVEDDSGCSSVSSGGGERSDESSRSSAIAYTAAIDIQIVY